MNENNSSTSLNQSNLKKNIQTKPIDHQKSINDQTIKILFGDETKKIIEHNDFSNNRISTTKYNLLIFIPKCLLFQFRRAANIYFLIICFLTSGSFSPKNPYSMIGTFAFVVLLTMFKEAYEDVKRYNSDKETNHRKAFKYNQQKKRFEVVTWDNINVGDIIRILNHDNIPADLLLIKSSLTSGLCFVDTMSLDGETNLKEMRCPSNTKNLTENDLTTLKGEIICEKPNEFLHKWEGTLFIESIPTILGAKQLLLRGSKLKNTEYIYGVVVYTGHSTKIMKNAQNPPLKLSNVMKLMNKLLYSVFIFQLIICLIFSICFILWQVKIGKYQKQLLIYDKDFKTKSLDPNLETLFIKFLTFLVAYSHFIPISLYVALEVVKMIQGLLIFYDDLMLDEMTGKSANSRTSDLIEELGQVQFLFTDKTGTLTRNEMIFKKCSIKNNIFSEIDKGNFKIKELLSKDSIFVNEENEKKSIIDFFTICSVCHSAFIQIYNRNLIYNSESPDEIALIEGAAKAGFKFFNKTSDTIEIQLDSGNKANNLGEYQIWKVILELPFDSTRKRMSVIVQNINNETEKCLYLFTKGADSEILNNLRHSDSENLKEIRDKLHSFAVEGLRCMVLAKKELKSVEVQSILEKFQKIYITCNSETEKEQNLNRLFYEVETEFEYVGITAVEDKLQEGVPETIEKLIKSDIRVWVLTGDKKETSLEIGKASKLINPDMSLIDLTIQFNSNSPQKEMIKLIDQSIEQYLNKNDQKKIAIIVDGPSLVYIFKDHNISQRFIKLGLKANSVICCRVSPKQKAQIVRLARNYTSEITLSIGDGANDVGMIFEANIGVGIHGKEGSSAVRSADYAFSQFRFLQRLLFIHGRLGYRRISLLICYYFYKNIVLVFTEFYFVFFNGFSGQIFFADILPLFYNSFWTSWPCIFCYSLDRDVDDEISLNYTVLYKAGQINYYFNLKKFWVWIIMALIHGAINFSSNMFGNRFFVDSSGLTKDHWFFSTIAFTCAIHIVTYKIFIDTMNWSKFTMTISFCSIFFYYVSACFICWPHIFNLVQSELNYTIFSMLSVIKTLILIICVPLICLLIDIVIRQYLYNFSPTPSQIIFKNSKKYKNMISNQNLAIQKEEMNCQTVELSKNIDEKQKPLCE